MKKIIFIAICMAAVRTNLCIAKSNSPMKAADWGESVQGVQLSVTMTNSDVRIGASATIGAVIKNQSTNDITLDISVPALSFDVLITNGAGKSYHIITMPALILYPRHLVKIKPGRENGESIPVTFAEDIEPGDYILKATRKFTTKDGGFTLESNSIKVQVLK